MIDDLRSVVPRAKGVSVPCRSGSQRHCGGPFNPGPRYSRDANFLTIRPDAARPQVGADPGSHRGCERDGSRRCDVDDAALWSRCAQRRRGQWRRLHAADRQLDGIDRHDHRRRARSRHRRASSRRFIPIPPPKTPRSSSRTWSSRPPASWARSTRARSVISGPFTNGIQAIDMPNFYLAHTEPTKPTTASLIHTIGHVRR